MSKRGAGSEVVGKVRGKIALALDICDRRNTPIEELLVEQFRADAAGTLQKLAKFFPQDTNLNHGGNVTFVTREFRLIEGSPLTPELVPEELPAPDVASPDEREEAGSLRLASEGGQG